MLDRINRWRAWLRPRQAAVTLIAEQQQRASKAERALRDALEETRALRDALEQRDRQLIEAGTTHQEFLAEYRDQKKRLIESRKQVRRLKQELRESSDRGVIDSRELGALREELETVTLERDRLQAKTEVDAVTIEGLYAWQSKVLARLDAEAAIESRRKQKALHSERFEDEDNA